MKPNIIVIGGSHGISENVVALLQEKANVMCFNRTHQFDVLSDAFPVEQVPDVIDGIVYAPGSINLKPFHLLKLEEFQHDLNLNTIGAVKILQALYPKLRKSNQASVVLFSTVAVQKGMSFHSSIAMAKGAIEGLVRSLAVEWAPKIRINAIAPSLVNTPLASKITGQAKMLEVTIEKHPMKRIGHPEDIAGVVEFLLSDRSSWMTGQVLAVDGGLSIV